MKGFYRRERIYRSKLGESVLFHEVCPKNLTLRKDLHPQIFKEIIRDGWCGTIFDEVNVLPFTEAYGDELKNFGMEKVDKVAVSEHEFSERAFETTIRTLFDGFLGNLNHYSNVYLGILSDNDIEVSFTPETKKASKEIVDKINAMVMVNGRKPRPFRTYSGGEIGKIEFSTQIALFSSADVPPR